MAPSREQTFNHHSPRSSSGAAESFRGTPDTRLTTFSSEEGSTQSATYFKKLGDPVMKLPSLRFPLEYQQPAGSSSIDKDPFVTPAAPINTALSPTASAFSPFETLNYSSASPADQNLPRGPSHHLLISAPGVVAGDIENWLINSQYQGSPSRECRHAISTHKDGVQVHFTDIRDACAVHSLILATKKDWLVSFANSIRDGSDSSGSQDLKTASVELAARGKAPVTSNPSGTVKLNKVMIHATPQPGCFVPMEKIVGTMHAFLASHGGLFSFSLQNTTPGMPCTAEVEFHDPKAAWHILATYAGGVVIDGVQLLALSVPQIGSGPTGLTHSLQNLGAVESLVKPGQPGEVETVKTTYRLAEHQNRYQQPFAYFPMMLQAPYAPAAPWVQHGHIPSAQSSMMNAMTSIQPLSPSYPILGSVFRTPPSPALTSRHDYSPPKGLATFNKPDYRRPTASRVTRSPYFGAAGHHNHVEIARIREGIDVRTTIMLRNIPNKVDQAMLKRIVDESSWGKYDFMYLRIDFANDCNVGYAFINFVDPLDIVDFVDARGNQRWNCFKSDKVAEISYATIQGKDCLVQKFRNSSVMLEAPHYRPKLFFTSNGPVPELAGQEEAFPEPDNQSKMKRSCENAEHVGLFTPNAGQHFRDEQRRRRSQYDRGTRLAALEEYDYESALKQLSGTAMH